MKRTTLITAALLLACTICGAETIKGSDSRISYIGRTEVQEDGSVSFDWSATTFRFSFKGKTLTMACSANQTEYFNLWIDSEQGPIEDRVLKVWSDTLITLVTTKKAAEHTIILQKRTEGEFGAFTLNELYTDGQFKQAPEPRPRLIEFIGDSYTCGYGIEALHHDGPFVVAEENPARTYADILGRLFNAETVHISHSGRGVVRNYGDYDKTENMVVRYCQTFDELKKDAWTPTYKPDLVVIYLGTNDFSEGKQPALWLWCQGYKKLLEKVHEFHGPDVPIICMASPCDELMDDYVYAAVERSGVKGVQVVPIMKGCFRYDDIDLGAAWHPNYSGNRKVASVVAPFVSSLMNWDLPMKSYEFK
ncbi:MAG: hypothetical protein J6X39_02430 [Bacteroidales bacterium]|nr:hypothetical protein [Bacteroidales bacterium]